MPIRFQFSSLRSHYEEAGDHKSALRPEVGLRSLWKCSSLWFRYMGRSNRCDFLRLCARSISALTLSKFDRPTSAADYSPHRTPSTIDRFIDPLPIPVHARRNSSGGRIRYRVLMLESRTQFHSQLPPTTVWGYEGRCPGLTFEAWASMSFTATSQSMKKMT